LSSRIVEDQFTSHCLCTWSTKSSKVIEDSTFCKQSVMYHVKSINSVTATMHEVTLKIGLLTITVHSVVAPSGELHGKGRCDVFAGKTV